MAAARAPAWKVVPGCGFAVDAFRHASDPAIAAFFLSHAHSDHYTGLSDRWDTGPIYCSAVTGRLLAHLVGVRPELIVALPMDEPQTIQGVEVTLVDANHCPGAVQFLFRLPDGRRYLHCGDMRFCDALMSVPHLLRFRGCDAVFLDTTYCNPKHSFPSQEESVQFVVDSMGRYLREEEQPGGKSHLFVICTYTIGKERILTAVAERWGCRIECSERKMETLRCLGLPDEQLDKYFTMEVGSSRVVLTKWGGLGDTWPFFRPNWTSMEAMRQERGVDKVIGFVPTGWTHKPNQREFPVYDKDELRIHLVPYSEHSSFDELQTYVRFLAPKQVIPTVGVGGDNGERNRVKMLEHFRNLMDQKSSKAEFLRGMRKAAPRATAPPPALPAADPVDLGEAGEEAAKHGGDAGGASPGTGSAVDNEADKELAVRECSQPAPAADSRSAAEACGPGNGGDTKGQADHLQQFMAILGGAMDAAAAARLLNLAEGDVQRALNMHYDGLAVRGVSSPVVTGNRSGAKSTAGSKRKSGVTSVSAAKKADSGRRHSTGQADKQVSITAFLRGAAEASAGSNEKDAVLEDGNGKAPQDNTRGGQAPEPAATDAPQPRGDGCGGGGISDVIPLLTPAQPEDSVSQGGAAAIASNRAATPGAAVDEPPRAPDSMTMDPGRYRPKAHACWAAGQPTPYLHLARTFAAVSSTTKRIATRDAFVNCFHAIFRLAPEDMLPAVYLACGKLAPDHEGVELSVGELTVSRAVMEATGTSRDRMREIYRKLGDLGDVAQSCRRNQVTLSKPAPLTVRGVYAALRKIAAEKGSGSGARRQAVVLRLLRSAREEETRFVVRTLVQNLRVGANWRSILGALGRAAALFHSASSGASGTISKADLESAETAAVEAFHVCPCLDVLVPALVKAPPAALEQVCTLRPGVPIKPMLAKIAEGIGEALRLGHAAGGGGGSSAVLAEYKYDGQRAQIHLDNHRKVFIFSRNGENITGAFPDVVDFILEAATGGAETLIIDAEIVAVDRQDGNRLRAFQELSTRARRDVSSADVKVHVAVFVFDLLLLDGESMLKRPLRERRERLADALPILSSGRVELARSMEIAASAPLKRQPGEERGEGPPPATDEAEAPSATSEAEAKLQEFLLESFAAGAEGLMVKQLDTGGYQPSKRSESWLKVKKDYCENLRDSLDLVPIGAWHGNGRKAGWLSPFLLAAWDPEAEEFQSVCRVMSGFSDQFYIDATERLGKLNRIDAPKPYYVTGERCSVWFEPTEVWEIRGADLTISPVHKAARGRLHAERGVSMRFPRFIRIRDDKGPMDASGPDVIEDLYNRQTRKVAPTGRGSALPVARTESMAGEGDSGRAADAAAGRPSMGVLQDEDASDGDDGSQAEAEDWAGENRS